MKKHLRLVALLIPIVLITSSSYAAVKAGSACSKVGSKSISGGKTYTCTKSGKKLVWNKGVLIPVAQPAPSESPSASATPVFVQVSEGDSCSKMGLQVKDSTGLLECRNFAGNKLAYIRINNDFTPLSNPKSPDPLTLCQLADKRTQSLPSLRQLSIAYPAKPIQNYPSSTGTFKVVVVGLDFPDEPGKGSPSEIWKDDLVKASQWLKWFTNDKVKLDLVTYPQWLRMPKESAKYEAADLGGRAPGEVQSGGLTTQQMSDDYIHTIEKTADLTDVASIWVYFPLDISKPMGTFNPQSANVQSERYGLVKSQIEAISADAYISQRIRFSYFLHEMIHSFGLQGHSPKFLPTGGYLNKNGMMSNNDGWTQVLLPWDSLVWDVAKESDIYCVDKSHLTSAELKLVPLEREQEGLRSAIIKLNDHQALVVESHRSDKWGVGEGAGFAGTMVSLIDTTVGTYFENNDSWHDPCVTSTGVYLKVADGNHGTHQPIGKPLGYNQVRVYNGIAFGGDEDNWDLNHIMYPGDSISAAGVKVTLLKGGDNDLVRIENIDNSITQASQPALPKECAALYQPFNPAEQYGSIDAGTQGATSGFRITTELTAPSNLKISTNGNSLTLNWNFSSKGKTKIEYYRVSGVCTKGGASCGTYTNDIWNLPSTEGAGMSLLITQSMLANPPSGGQWIFSLSAANQSAGVSTAAVKFDTVTL
jgi:hypothetical protein